MKDKKKRKLALDIIANIDWGSLKLQKMLLYKHIAYLIEIDALDQADCLEGLINMLDIIQDFAVDALGVKEEQVFINSI